MLRQRKWKLHVSSFFTRQLVEFGSVFRVNLLKMYPHFVFPAGLVAAEVAPERFLAEVDDGHVTLGLVLPTEHLKERIQCFMVFMSGLLQF